MTDQRDRVEPDPTDPRTADDPAKLRTLADWFDLYNPNDQDPEVQRDLRRIAAELVGLRAELQTARAQLATVRALLSPEAGMASTPFGDGKRYFAESDIRAALEVTD